jgi:hypothetical protein
MSRLAVALTLAVSVSACGSDNELASPASPSAQRPPDATFTVSGVVSGQGGAPVAGAQVRVASQQGTTDASGHYSLSGVPSSYGGTSAIKAGYAAGRKIVAVSGDMQLDFELGPPIAIYTVSGVVSEETPAGLVPIEGVKVGVTSCQDLAPAPPFFGDGCSIYISPAATTDRRGFYSLSGLYPGTKNDMVVAKEGFEDPLAGPEVPEGSHTQVSGRRLTITGDARYDIQLIRH